MYGGLALGKWKLLSDESGQGFCWLQCGLHSMDFSLSARKVCEAYSILNMAFDPINNSVLSLKTNKLTHPMHWQSSLRLVEMENSLSTLF